MYCFICKVFASTSSKDVRADSITPLSVFWHISVWIMFLGGAVWLIGELLLAKIKTLIGAKMNFLPLLIHEPEDDKAAEYMFKCKEVHT